MNDDLQEILKTAGDHNLNHSSGWYLHGRLEELCYYDLATIYNMSDFPEDIRKTLRWNTMINNKATVSEFKEITKSYLHGIYPVKVYGIQEDCIGYFWITDEEECVVSNNLGEERKFTNWNQRGLVCLRSDKEGIEYARKCYAENRSHL